MKISDFANKFKVSNDTVRYYMELNLLTPEKKGGHYYYDKSCESQMKETLKLKEMGFSLQEIKKIFNFKRMGKLTAYQRNKYYQGLYQSKIQDINDKLKVLENAKKKLEEKIVELKLENEENKIKLGVNLSVLSLLACPKCGGELALSAKKVENNQIFEGSLNCECGENLKIEEGIIYTDNYAENIEHVEENHIEKYIKNTDPDFIDKSYESLSWLKREFEAEEIFSKVIMEPGTGYGHFLRQIYDNFTEDTIYICIDHKPQLLKYVKRLLELTGKKAKIIFITANLPELPIKQNKVDLLVDFTGTSEYAFSNKEFLPEVLDPYMKEEAIFIGSFIVYERFGPNAVVTLPYRKNFKYKNIKNEILSLDYKLDKEYKSQIVKIEKSMGKYEEFAQIGDELYSYQLKAKR